MDSIDETLANPIIEKSKYYGFDFKNDKQIEFNDD
jgi:hypothetical protein